MIFHQKLTIQDFSLSSCFKLVSIPKFHIRFLNLSSYVDMSLYDINKQANIVSDPIFLAQKAITSSWQEETKFPPLSCFLDEMDSPALKSDKAQFHLLHSHDSWGLLNHCFEFCSQQIEILSSTALNLIAAAFSFQRILLLNQRQNGLPSSYTEPKPNEHTYVFLVGWPIVSVAGFSLSGKYFLPALFLPHSEKVLLVLRTFCFDTSQMYALPHTYTSMGQFDNCSRGEYELAAFTMFSEPEKVRTAWSHPNGQLAIKTGPKKYQKPDIVFKRGSTTQYLEYKGCYQGVHGQCLNQSLRKKIVENGKHRCGLSMKEKMEETEKKMEEIRQAIGNGNYQMVWECQWKLDRQERPEVLNFFNHHYHPRPLHRLVPSIANRGSNCQIFR